MLITSKLEIDLQQPGFKKVAYAVQSDSNTRALEISLFLGGSEWAIPAGTTAAVSFRKMDLTSGLYDTLPDGSTKAVTFSGNTLTAILAPQVLTCAGKVDISIALYDSNLNRLGVFPVLLYVSIDPSAGKSISNNYYYLSTLAAVNEAIGDLNNLKTSTKESLVAAINELAQGTVTESQIQDAVDAYLEKNGTGSILVDSTLTKEGYAADAKATGDALSKLSGGNPPQDGEDGFSPIATVTQTADGATITITDKDGTTTATVTNGKDGADGVDGKDGYTPQKGVDYFDGQPGKDGVDGEDGYTPVKGVDYFDGSPGKDGKDGNPGAAGKTPVKGTDYWTEADQEAIVQQVIAALGTPVFGTVDAENNIILSGALADGTYTIKYEDADGNQTEIGTIEVGGVSYTNLADPTSEDWAVDKRLNSSAALADATGCQTTNFFPCVKGDVIRVKGLDIRYTNSEHTQHAKAFFYNAGTSNIVGTYPLSDPKILFDGVDTFIITLDGLANVSGGSEEDVVKGRLSGMLFDGYTSEDVIITVNQEIV